MSVSINLGGIFYEFDNIFDAELAKDIFNDVSDNRALEDILNNEGVDYSYDFSQLADDYLR